MRQLRKRTHLVRPIAALLLTALLHGCIHWSDVPLEPQRLPTGSARVTLKTGSRFHVTHPEIVRDSLVWHVVRDSLAPQDLQPAGSVPLAQVMSVEARKLDPVATGFWVLTAGVFLTFRIINQ